MGSKSRLQSVKRPSKAIQDVVFKAKETRRGAVFVAQSSSPVRGRPRSVSSSAPSSPKKRRIEPPEFEDWDMGGGWVDEDFPGEADEVEVRMVEKPAKKSGNVRSNEKSFLPFFSCTCCIQNTRTVLLQGLEKRDDIIDTLLKIEDRPEGTICFFCHDASEVQFRCLSCIGRPFTCHSCCLNSHQHNPFHQIQQWNGGFFHTISLRSLGFQLRMGHHGGPCPESPGHPFPPHSLPQVRRARNGFC